MLAKDKVVSLNMSYFTEVVRDPSEYEMYQWSHGSWNNCSEICAGGYQRRLTECHRVDNKKSVPEHFCNSEVKPDDIIQTCNAQPCPAEWYVSKWNRCSATCGGGLQHRTVICKRKTSEYDEEQREEDECPEPKPIFHTGCNEGVCPPSWREGKWSEVCIALNSFPDNFEFYKNFHKTFYISVGLRVDERDGVTALFNASVPICKRLLMMPAVTKTQNHHDGNAAIDHVQHQGGIHRIGAR